MKSASEELCRLKFNEFLGKVSPAPTSWRDVPQQEEPPDYYLVLDGTEYAVEVTILMKDVRVGSLSQPELSVQAAQWDLVDQVEKAAEQAGYLHGSYIVSFRLPIENFGRVKGQIRQALLAYIQETQNMASAPEKIVYRHRNQQCSIEKGHNRSDGIGKSYSPAGRAEGEIVAEICDILEKRLATKKDKLQYIPNPRILLLHDLYHCAQPSMFRDCLDKLRPLLASFYAVFIVQEETNGFLLYSMNSAWAYSGSGKA